MAANTRTVELKSRCFSTAVFLIMPLLVFQLCVAAAHATPDDDHEKGREVLTYLLSQLHQGDYGLSDYSNSPDLCRCQPSTVSKRNSETNNFLYRLVNSQKRNSELINSLLRLPKTVNEVGRK